jgi:hypothetical protein
MTAQSEPSEGVGEGEPGVGARLAVGQVVVDVDVGVLVVGVVVVDVGFAVGVLGGGHPLAEPFGDRSVVNPVDHVAGLPGVVAAPGGLEAAGRVVLIRERRGRQGNVEAIERGGLTDEVAGDATCSVSAECPVVVRAFGDEHRRVAQVGWTEVVDRLPVQPLRGLGEFDAFERARPIERVNDAAIAGGRCGGRGVALIEVQVLAGLPGVLPLLGGIDLPGLLAGTAAGRRNGQQDKSDGMLHE